MNMSADALFIRKNYNTQIAAHSKSNIDIHIRSYNYKHSKANMDFMDFSLQ